MQDYEKKYPVYDIVNVGKNNRFTIRTKDGAMLVHNCILGLGYGTGWAKLQQTLKVQAGIELSDTEAQRIVEVYRTTYPMIRQNWKECDRALREMINGWNGVVGFVCPLTFYKDKIYLPSGRSLYYPELSLNEEGKYEYRRTRYKATIYGAKVVENIVQSLARDIVLYQTCSIAMWLRKQDKEKADGKIRRVVLSVHDEAVVVVPEEEAEETKAYMMQAMRKSPAWCSDLPLNCEADIGHSYGECK